MRNITGGSVSEWEYYRRFSVRVRILQEVQCQSENITGGSVSEWEYYRRFSVRVRILHLFK